MTAGAAHIKDMIIMIAGGHASDGPTLLEDPARVHPIHHLLVDDFTMHIAHVVIIIPGKRGAVELNTLPIIGRNLIRVQGEACRSAFSSLHRRVQFCGNILKRLNRYLAMRPAMPVTQKVERSVSARIAKG
jgi:hypothetical protein